jgi:hypothetical protein
MRKIGGVIALAALLLSTLVAPARADTVIISPTSQITFDNTLAHDVRFDGLNRAWIWNSVWSPGESNTPRLAIFAQVSGSWTRVQTVATKKLTIENLRFGPDGTAYVANPNKNEIVTFPVDEAGIVGKTKRIRLKGRQSPIDAFPNSAGHLFVLYSSRVLEFSLPLSKHPRPIRTVTSDFADSWKLVASADGTIFTLQGEYQPILVFAAGVSGSVDPSRALLIDSALAGYQQPTDIAMTPAGKIAVVYWLNGVAIFEPDSFGSSVTPTTWYPVNDPLSNPQGVDFMPSGVMGVADYGGTTAVKVYFED